MLGCHQNENNKHSTPKAIQWQKRTVHHVSLPNQHRTNKRNAVARMNTAFTLSCEHSAGAYTAKRYALWQSRQAVLNAQLTGTTGASTNQLDTETAAADAIAALGKTLHHS